MKNSEGWDGKMRVEPKAVITNPEALEDSDYSDPDAPPVEEIEADEGTNPAERLQAVCSELICLSLSRYSGG